MLSFKPFDNEDSLLVAMYQTYHKKTSKYVFYDKDHDSNEKYNKEDLKELLTMQYGKTEVMYEKHMKTLELDPKFAIIRAPKTVGSFIPFYPFNQHNERNIHYIFGKNGLGKSYLAKQLSKEFSKLMNVFIISPVIDDEYHGTFLKISDLVEIDETNDYEKSKLAYENAKVKLRYKKKSKELDDKELLQLECLLNELKPKKEKTQLFKFTDEYDTLIKKPSLWIYDDTETESDKPKLEFIQASQLLTGRHNNINMIILNHQANSGCKTRNVINESNVFSFFSPYNRYIQYFLHTYLQFEKKHLYIIADILRTNRSITIYKDLNLLLTQDKIITF